MPTVESILSPGQGLRTRAKRTTGKQGLRYVVLSVCGSDAYDVRYDFFSRFSR